MTETTADRERRDRERRDREQFDDFLDDPHMIRLAKEAETRELWHGLRSKLSSDELHRRGFCTFRTWIDGRRAITKALEYFGKKKLLTITQSKVHDFVDEISREGRLCIWVTTYREDAAHYANRNPEIIFLMLHFAGVSDYDVLKYLRIEFGKPYRVKLKFKPTALDLFRNAANIPTFKMCIRPDEIELVEECTDLGLGSE